jgi:hypothetical protein
VLGHIYVMTDSAVAAFVERHTPWQLPDDPAVEHRLRSSWVSVMNARAEALCPLRRTEIGDGYLTLVHEVPMRAAPLAAIRERGPLRFGQVAAVGVRMCRALSAMHDERTAHGAVQADNVLVAQDGQVWLAGSGLWTAAPNAGGPTACDDVRDLALMLHMLAGAASLPTAVELLVIRAQDPDPTLRPSLDQFAATLLRPDRRDSGAHPITRDIRSLTRTSAPPRPQPAPRISVLRKLRATH